MWIGAIALIAAGAGCGEVAATPEQRLAASLRGVVEHDIEFGHAYGVLDARCEGSGAESLCTVDIHASPDAIQQDFDVQLAGDGCWTADRVALGRAGGRSLASDELEPETLRGCVE